MRARSVTRLVSAVMARRPEVVVRQLDTVAAGVLESLAAHMRLFPSAVRVAWPDVDDTVRETHGYAKQELARRFHGGWAGRLCR